MSHGNKNSQLYLRLVETSLNFFGTTGSCHPGPRHTLLSPRALALGPASQPGS
ncbi:hypothetical protein D623_10032387 [Myotis brandtii]|uniref:Uncharacterized protein n=1 Tax=Myotis brandtii TaxID=109478 RepID=S7N7D8_MYOBR|nr:hypothetical protein D623_10032387 [Myotis brandtii]